MKDKFKDLLSFFNVPMVMFIAYAVKMMVSGATISDAIALIAISSVYGYHKHLYRKNEIWNDRLKEDLDRVKATLESVQHKTNARTLYEAKNKEKVRKF